MFIPIYLSPRNRLAGAESEDLLGLKQTGASQGCPRLAPVITNWHVNCYRIIEPIWYANRDG